MEDTELADSSRTSHGLHPGGVEGVGCDGSNFDLRDAGVGEDV